MAYTASFSVSVGDPTKASDVSVLAANDDFLKAAVDAIMHNSATPTAVLKTAVTTQTLHAADDDTLKLASTSFVKRAADAAGISFSNDGDNRVVTGTGSGINGEANLTFDGSTLTVTGTADVSGDFTAGTVNADSDTAASDNAAMGYTSADGLILTGQGSTNDVVIKNDADAIALRVATGTQFIAVGLDYAAVPVSPLVVTGAKNSVTIPSTGGISIHDSTSMALGVGGLLQFTGNFTGTNLTTAASIHAAKTNGTDSEYGFDLAFCNRTNGGNNTEKMRISSSGNVGIGVAPTNYILHAVQTGSYYTVLFLNSHGSSPHGIGMGFTGAAPDNRTNHFLHCYDTGADRLVIWSDGDVENADNSYGALSDLKLKQDITDVRDYWDDFKAIRFRKFKFKTDVAAYGDDAQSLFGVVAQEAETVFPSLVRESPDREFQDFAVLDEDGNPTYEQTEKLDDDGNIVLDDDDNAVMVEKPITEEKQVDLGTTTKGFKYSILGQIGLKVVQELQTRLEAAEAKITALESA